MQDSIPQKCCTKCGEIKTIDLFDRSAPTICKVCRNKGYKAYRERIRDLPDIDLPLHKTCVKCGKTKPIECFTRERGSKQRYRSSCKDCKNKRWAQRKADTPESISTIIRRSNLKNGYGISLEEYDAMFETQGGLCKVCRQPETARNQYGPMRLCIDHDHATREIRGLLCSRCNAALGLLNEDPARIESLLSYITFYKKAIDTPHQTVVPLSLWEGV